MEVIFDAFGREAHRYTSEAIGRLAVDTTYDLDGRVYSVTNPYRSVSDATYGVTKTTYDALNRKLLVTEQDGSTLRFQYTGPKTDSWDEAQNHMQHTSDPLGRLVYVAELGSASALMSLETDYAYDPLGNLKKIVQQGAPGEGARVRSFTYDSLSRLVNSKNPETGTICYGSWTGGACQNGYDANSNLVAKTDARSIKLTYGYDRLNRLTSKTGPGIGEGFAYDDPSPGNFSASNPIGRLVEHANPAGGTSTQFSYDAVGHINLQGNTLPNGCCIQTANLVTALYDLAGNLTDLTYPSGRHLHQSFDEAGRLGSPVPPTIQPGAPVQHSATVQDVGNSQEFVESIDYNVDGSNAVLTLGNGVQQTTVKNIRFQVQDLKVSSPFRADDLPFLSQTYCYLDCSSWGPTGLNNGNIWQITDKLNPGRTQTFSYDGLNRINTFSLGGALRESYGLDSFGNLWGELTDYRPKYDPLTNRVNAYVPNGSAPAALAPAVPLYDDAGNQTSDQDAYGAPRTYTWDAQSRIATIALSGYPAFESYTYGADGMRVRKDSPGDNSYTEYVYFGGNPIAEKSQTGTQPAVWTDYVYANGQKIARIEPFDVRAHLSGTRVDGSMWWVWPVYVLPLPNQIPIAAKDTLAFRMYQHNARGKISVSFTDGSNSDWYSAPDQNGDTLSGESRSDQWVNRWFDLNQIAGGTGKVISSIFVEDAQGSPAGGYDVMVADMDVIHADGTVTPIVGRSETSTTPPNSSGCNPVGSSWPISCITERVSDTQDFAGSPATTRFTLSDHLGTASLDFTAGGWPVWQGQFAPFGAELNQQTTTNHYKFTGKERDTESGLDYFGARYYSSNMGRWMSPDWSASPSGVPYASLGDPQSLNLYGYVGNNPLSRADADGHCDPGQCMAIAMGIFNGIMRDGGVKPYLKNVGIGIAKGLGSLAVNGARLAAAGQNPGAIAAALTTPGPKRLKPSNTTQAQASLATQIVVPAVAGMAAGPLMGAAAGAGAEAESGVGVGAQLFRVFGNDATGFGNPNGAFFTTMDPATAVPDFRTAAGLFPGNSGQFVMTGTLNDMTGVTAGTAAPGPGGVGGTIPEVIVPNAAKQVTPTSVSGANPPF